LREKQVIGAKVYDSSEELMGKFWLR